MQTNISWPKTMSRLPRVPMDDALMTIMLLNDQPIIAIAAEVHRERSDRGERGRYCHLVRIDETWAEA